MLVGAFELNNHYEIGRMSITPSKIIIHDGWNPFVKRFTDDIAVLMLESEVKYTQYIQPICLLRQNDGSKEGIVAGWGKSESSKNKHENIPLVVEIPIEPNAECYRKNYILATIAWDKSFCAGTKGVGVCSGDSGSAFFVKLGSKFYFKGLVSSSLKSDSGCSTDDFSIYTDVTKYFDFIQNPQNSRKIPELLENIENFSTDDDSSKFSCGVTSSRLNFVVSEKISSNEQFPWVVSVWKRKPEGFEFQGDGSLVTSQHVVTQGD